MRKFDHFDQMGSRLPSEDPRTTSEEAPVTSPQIPQGTPSGPVRRLYDWVLHWAHTPYGAIALTLVSFFESSVFPIPPDPLLIALGISRPQRAMWYGLLCTAASVLGGLLGYAIGGILYESIGQGILELYGKEELFAAVSEKFTEAGFFAVLIAAFTPIPYKVFTIAAGVAGLPLSVFVSASLIGRGGRFLAVSWLVAHYGEPIRVFIDRWFTWLTWLFVLLGIGGVVLAEGLFTDQPK